LFERLPIQCHSSAAQLEILAKANHLECIMAEVPVSWMPPANPPLDPVEKQRGRDMRRLFFRPEFDQALVANGPSSSSPLSGGAGNKNKQELHFLNILW
jgi:hypothetical protein